MTEEDVVQVVLEELALDQNRTDTEVRAELEERGRMLPIDSIILADIVVALEERLGIRIPEDRLTARAMGSVRSFARRILQILATAARERRGA